MIESDAPVLLPNVAYGVDADIRAHFDELGIKAAPDTAYHLIGPYNSGTNFASRLLDINKIPQTPTEKAPRIHKDLCKHYPYMVVRKVRKRYYRKLHKAIFLVLVRDPFRWLGALKKAPYEMEYVDYSSPCRVGLHALNYDECYGDHLNRLLPSEDIGELFKFANVVDYWNQFYRGYLNAHHDGEIQVLFLRYEDLIFNTAECIHVLRILIGGPALGDFHIPSDPSKSHGTAAGFITARSRCRTPRTDGFSDQDKATIEQRISTKISDAMGYPLHV